MSLWVLQGEIKEFTPSTAKGFKGVTRMNFIYPVLFLFFLVSPVSAASLYPTSVGTIVDGFESGESSNFQITGSATVTQIQGGTTVVDVSGSTLEDVYWNVYPPYVSPFTDYDGTWYVRLIDDVTLAQQPDGSYSGTVTSSFYPVVRTISPPTWGDVSYTGFASSFSSPANSNVCDNLFLSFDLSGTEMLCLNVLLILVSLVLQGLGFISFIVISLSTTEV